MSDDFIEISLNERYNFAVTIYMMCIRIDTTSPEYHAAQASYIEIQQQILRTGTIGANKALTFIQSVAELQAGILYEGVDKKSL